jgi:hypothetical protein
MNMRKGDGIRRYLCRYCCHSHCQYSLLLGFFFFFSLSSRGTQYERWPRQSSMTDGRTTYLLRRLASSSLDRAVLGGFLDLLLGFLSSREVVVFEVALLAQERPKYVRPLAQMNMTGDERTAAL